jgi:hypothetical protein
MVDARGTRKQGINEGRIEIPPKGKIPAYKRYFDEMK